MLGKVVLLIAASAVLSSGLKVDPEDLLTLYDHVDSTIKLTEHEAQIEIRNVLLPLNNLLDEAASYVLGNLSIAAESYWTKIASLEEQAESEGEDISACINSGNEQVYALNETTISAQLAEIAAYREEGNETVYKSSDLAYSAVEELLELEIQVKSCSEPACAEELFNALIEFHGRAEETLEASVNTPMAYLEALPEKLAQIKFDSETYAEKLSWILDAVEICIIL